MSHLRIARYFTSTADRTAGLGHWPLWLFASQSALKRGSGILSVPPSSLSGRVLGLPFEGQALSDSALSRATWWISANHGRGRGYGYRQGPGQAGGWPPRI